MVPDLACFALLLAHDHESVKRKDFFPFCGLKIANTASLVIDQASVIAYPYSSFWQKHLHFQDGGDVTNPAGLSPCILPR